MSRRRVGHHRVSAKLIAYLTQKRGMTQAAVADILEVGPSFISRVLSQERDLSPEQIRMIADALGVEMGTMLLDALRPTKPVSAEKQKILDLCAELMHKADAVIAATRAERAASSKRSA